MKNSTYIHIVTVLKQSANFPAAGSNGLLKALHSPQTSWLSIWSKICVSLVFSCQLVFQKSCGKTLINKKLWGLSMQWLQSFDFWTDAKKKKKKRRKECWNNYSLNIPLWEFSLWFGWRHLSMTDFKNVVGLYLVNCVFESVLSSLCFPHILSFTHGKWYMYLIFNTFWDSRPRIMFWSYSCKRNLDFEMALWKINIVLYMTKIFLEL